MRLSWPATVTQVGLMLTGVVDTLMLARVSVDALAASALGHDVAVERSLARRSAR